MRVTRLMHGEKLFSNSNWQFVKSFLDKTLYKKCSPIITCDLTEKCNFSCNYCIDRNRTIDNKNPSEIEWQWLKDLLPELRKNGCRALELSGGGEPTLYSKFDETVLLATNLGFRLSLITNGSQLKYLKNVIVNGSFDWIRISLDASNAETHMRMHGTRKNWFANIVEGAREIAQYKTVGVSFVVTEMNSSELYDAANMSKLIGAKYFEMKPTVCASKTEFHDYSKISNFIIREFERAKTLETSDFQILMTHSFSEILNNNSMEQEKRYKQCYAAYLRMVLSPVGLYLCPYHRNTPISIKDLSVEEIIEARNTLISTITPNTQCKNYCARNECNEILIALMDIQKNHPNIIKYLGWPMDYGDDTIWI